jgi:hypothetical protein
VRSRDEEYQTFSIAGRRISACSPRHEAVSWSYEALDTERWFPWLPLLLDAPQGGGFLFSTIVLGTGLACHSLVLAGVCAFSSYFILSAADTFCPQSKGHDDAVEYAKL